MTSRMGKFGLAAALAVLPAAAQASLELGGLAGGGAFAVSSGVAAARGQAGVEVCVFCPGRFALFGEYSHWFGSSSNGMAFYSDRVATADLAGGGLRIQGRGKVRPFFDAGVVAGRDEHERIGYGGFIGGVVLGVGVSVPLGEHLYIRPQFRAYGLSPHSIEGLSAHWAASGGVGVGLRF